MMTMRLPKLSVALSLFALLMTAAPAPAQLGIHFTSEDGVITFHDVGPNPDGTLHVPFDASGTETAAGLGVYGGDGSYDADLSGSGTISNGTATLVFSPDDTLTIAFEGRIDPPPFGFMCTWTVTDATGALAGADGGGTVMGTLFPDFSGETFMLDGDI